METQHKSQYTYIPNQFHKDSIERCLKAIAEMKKKPMNYEEEYARHKKMSELAKQAEIATTKIEINKFKIDKP